MATFLKKLALVLALFSVFGAPVSLAGPAFDRLMLELGQESNPDDATGVVGGQAYRFLGVMAPNDAEGAQYLAAAVDETILGLLNSSLGQSLCRYTLGADPALLVRFLGLQPDSAEIAAERCRSYSGPRHEMLGTQDVESRQREISSPSRVYALWWTLGERNELLSLSHLGGWVTHIFLFPHLELPLSMRREAVLSDFRRGIALQVFGHFFDQSIPNLEGFNPLDRSLFLRQLNLPVLGEALTAIRQNRVARELGVGEPKVSCLQEYRRLARDYFPILAPAIVRDRQKPIVIADARSGLSVQDRMIYLLMLSQLGDSFRLNNIHIARRSRLVGAELVANFVMIFTNNDSNRQSFEENRSLLFDRYLNLTNEINLFSDTLGAEDNCNRLTQPRLGWIPGYRRIVPSLR